MELSSFQRITIQHQFDRFAKLVIAGEAKKHKKSLYGAAAMKNSFRNCRSRSRIGFASKMSIRPTTTALPLPDMMFL